MQVFTPYSLIGFSLSSVIGITFRIHSIGNFNGLSKGRIVWKPVFVGIGTNPYGPMTCGNMWWSGSLRY